MAGDSRGSRHARRTLLTLAAAALLPGTAGIAPAAAQPVPVAQPAATAAPATLQRVEWLTDRRVALWVNSPSMGVPIPVQLLLARDWNTHPDAQFPVMFMLDGLRATDDENGWTKEAHAQDFYADKNVTVVLPIGGQSSFYSDWLQPDNGKLYKWETFLTQELPPLLTSAFRASSVRGVEGLSMGGTAAMFLAARNPGWARYAASYSGFLTTTSLGMPDAIRLAMHDAGGFDPVDMWGPPTDDQWAQHDPYDLADKLKNVSLYTSAGSGTSGTSDIPSELIPLLSQNYAGTGLEILSRLTTQNFVAKLNKLSIPVQANYRPAGTHTWPYWGFEMRQSWPQAAVALNVDQSPPNCGTGGDIAPAAQSHAWLGDCLTAEYPVAAGVAQDFHGGRMFWSGATGAHPVGGMIGGSYSASGAAAGPLGFPTGDEQGLPDGRGRFQPFQNGFLYWSPSTGAQLVHGAILDAWAKDGYERGPDGYPASAEVKTPHKDGVVQAFENGPIYWSAKTGAHRVQGAILQKFAQLGYEDSPLGFPADDEQPLRDGARYSRFEGGNVYYHPVAGTWAVRSGPIMDIWGQQGFENGMLGFPVSDQFDIPGGSQQNFQGGFVTVVDGKASVHAPGIDVLAPLPAPAPPPPGPEPAAPVAAPGPDTLAPVQAAPAPPAGNAAAAPAPTAELQPAPPPAPVADPAAPAPGADPLGAPPPPAPAPGVEGAPPIAAPPPPTPGVDPLGAPPAAAPVPAVDPAGAPPPAPAAAPPAPAPGADPAAAPAAGPEPAAGAAPAAPPPPAPATGAPEQAAAPPPPADGAPTPGAAPAPPQN